MERDLVLHLLQRGNRKFQLTRSRGAWRQEMKKLYMNLHFNSHAHVERDDWLRWLFPRRTYFNSHAHVERDEQMTPAINALSDFNSHAHVERDISAKLGGNKLDDFNSHAHVERDQLSRR